MKSINNEWRKQRNPSQSPMSDDEEIVDISKFTTLEEYLDDLVSSMQGAPPLVTMLLQRGFVAGSIATVGIINSCEEVDEFANNMMAFMKFHGEKLEELEKLETEFNARKSNALREAILNAGKNIH